MEIDVKGRWAGGLMLNRETARRRPVGVIAVLAWWVEIRGWDGTPYAHDLGASPRLVARREPRAAVWLNNASEGDVERARAHAASARPEEGESERVVFVYPRSEPDPLGRARREVLL